jgi:hypothetical protein
MMSRRTLVLALTICALAVGGFFTGRVTAKQLGQALPRERNAAYTFPRAWGELKNVTSTSRGYTYVFVAENGTIRVVQSSPVGPEDIEVITR